MSQNKLTLNFSNVAPDGCHIVTVTLGETEVHRDRLLVDRAEDRRRFIDALVTKLPSIVDGAAVSPDDIDAQLIAFASR